MDGGKRILLILVGFFVIMGIFFAIAISMNNSPSQQAMDDIQTVKESTSKYSNFTANGVSFEYMSNYMTVEKGTGNTIAKLNYTTDGAPGYIKKYPGMSLDVLKADILSETFQNDVKVSETTVGRDFNYNGYEINAKANAPYNLTEDFIIFETGGTSYEIMISGKSGSSLSYILSPIKSSIVVT